MPPRQDPPDYDALEKEMWAVAVKEVKEEASTRLQKRITLMINRFDFDREEILKKIEEDDMFATYFATEPRRTGVHQKIASEWLEKINEIIDFNVLPSSGENSLKVTSDGEVVLVRETRDLPGKSLDFQWKMRNQNNDIITCYAMHKYTKEGGGNQDSQFKEMQELMKRYQNNTDPKTALLIIVDGEYYNKKKMQKLDFGTRKGRHMYACHIEGVPEKIQKIINEE